MDYRFSQAFNNAQAQWDNATEDYEDTDREEGHEQHLAASLRTMDRQPAPSGEVRAE